MHWVLSHLGSIDEWWAFKQEIYRKQLSYVNQNQHIHWTKKQDDHQYKLQLKLQHCLQKEVSQEHGRYSINIEYVILLNIDN